MPLRIDCISDLHGSYPELEGGDLLIIAGDITASDKVSQWQQFGFWLNAQKYQHKVWIAGNHDGLIQRRIEYAREFVSGAHYLQDESIKIEGYWIYGSPWTPTFYNWHFMQNRGKDIKRFWDKIPDDTDILVTHGPPYGILDECLRYGYPDLLEHVGCEELRYALERVKPKLHVFGHIHQDGGKSVLFKHEGPNTICVNASLMNEHYVMTNQPVRILL